VRLSLVLVLAAGCSEDPVRENPVVVKQPTSDCGASKRLVRDVCTKLGSNDACVEVDDVCIALCDGATSCSVVGDLRLLNPWGVAPDAYCVECVTP